MLATLVVIGMGCLMVFGREPPRRLLTASLDIDYTRSAQVGDCIDVRMDTPKIGRQMAFANVRLMVGDKPVARASALFAVVAG